MHTYYIDYQENSSCPDVNIIFNGINDEIAKIKGLTRIRPFGLFVKDQAGLVFGGATGISYYGCLYVDMLWVQKELRLQGWGKSSCKMLSKLASRESAPSRLLIPWIGKLFPSIKS